MATSQELYEQQMTLAEQVAAEERRIAEQAASYKRKSLAEELDEQRRTYAQGLGTLAEQSYGQGSKLLAGLSDRGLATSGLLQLGDVQTQMAKGGALSDLAYQDRLSRENIRESERTVETDLATALRQAQLDKQTAELSAEETLYSREQADLASQREAGVAIIQSFVEAGLLDDEAATDYYTRIMGLDTDDETGIGAIVEEAQAEAESADKVMTGVLGESVFDEKTYAKENTLSTTTITIGGTDYIYDWSNPEASNAQLLEVYDNSDLRYAGEGLITIDAARTALGAGFHYGQDIIKDKPFVTPDGQRFSTWNLAADHLDELAEQE